MRRRTGSRGVGSGQVESDAARRFRLQAALGVALATALALTAHGASAASISATWLGGSGSWSDASRWDSDPLVPNNDVTNTFDVAINASSLTLDLAVAVDTLAQSGGVLSGAFDLTLVDAFDWSGGSQLGAGTTRSAGLEILGTTAKTLQGRTLENTGDATLRGNGSVLLRDGAVLRNAPGATFSADSAIGAGGTGGDLLIDRLIGSASFDNQGSFLQSGSQTTTIDVAFDNSGSVDVGSGTLLLTSGGTQTGGNTSLANAATLRFGGGTHALDAASAISGDGTLLVTSGVLNHAGSYAVSGTTRVQGGTANLTGVTSSTTNLELAGGALDLDGDLAVSEDTAWSAGTLRGSGSATLGGIEITGTALRTLDTATLENTGDAALRGSGTLSMRGGAVLRNAVGALFTANSDSALGGTDGDLLIDLLTGSGTFENQGGFVQAGMQTTTVDVGFDNSGSVDVQNGTLTLTRGGSHSGGLTSIANGATLRFGGGTHALDATSAISGDGTLLLTSGTLDHAGSLDVTGTTRVQAGTLHLTHAAAATTHLELAGGALDNDGGLSVSGDTQWSAGALRGDGVTTVAGIEVLGANAKSIQATTLVNTAAAALRGSGTLSLRDGALLRNAVGASFTANSDSGLGGTDGDLLIDLLVGAATFDNRGSFLQTGAQRTAIDVGFANSGSVEVANGELALTRGYTQTAGATRLTGGLLASQPLDIQGGRLEGSGQIDADVLIGATLAPGLSAGALSIDGDITLAGSAVFEVEIGGLLRGTDYDAVDASGNATLAGVLSVSFLAGFDALIDPADTFSVLTAANDVLGLFANAASGDRVTTAEGHSFRVDYGALSPFGTSSLVLSQFKAVPEPGTALLLAFGLLAVVCSRGPRTRSPARR